MKGLFKSLPPFAPDYSGVCSVLFELGGLAVILDGGGCTGNFTGYDEPRWYGATSAVFSSGVREIDAIVGDDEKLLRKIENAVQYINPRFIAIVGTPATMVIGTDYQALARLLAKKINLPVLTFDTNGIDYYDIGASKAFLEIARNFIKPVSVKNESGVNIIGATPLDILNNSQINKLTTLLISTGYKTISCWAMGSSLDDITNSAQAKLNIVISHVGLEAAKYMESNYGIPYLTGIPIGRHPTIEFCSKIRSLLGLDVNVNLNTREIEPLVSKYAKNALVIGEQLLSNAVRDCLRYDLNITEVKVASFFRMYQSCMEQGDILLEGEIALTNLAREHHFDVIIGDPLFKSLLDPSENSHFVSFPHIAVSSRLYWENDLDFIGEEGLYYFKEKIFDSVK